MARERSEEIGGDVDAAEPHAPPTGPELAAAMVAATLAGDLGALAAIEAFARSQVPPPPA